MQQSRPARGAWVEIVPVRVLRLGRQRRAPQGARGLKFAETFAAAAGTGRAPQGARGLKYNMPSQMEHGSKSRPARGAWVEIFELKSDGTSVFVAPRKGRVG